MSWKEFFRTRIKPSSANIAKERLQIIVAHERANNKKKPDYLPQLQKDIMEVISRYINVSRDQVSVNLDQNDDCSILELNITLPES
ncbi:MAG: cell division topological specificity factor MinE, partial [Pseudomonadota bacterium]